MKPKKSKYELKDCSGKQVDNYMDGWIADYEVTDKNTSLIVAAFTNKAHAELFMKILAEEKG